MRGGKREGAGRHKILQSAMDRVLLVGQCCEDIQTTERDAQALQRYESQPHIKVLRDAQEMLRGAADEDRATIATNGDEDIRTRVTTAEQASQFIEEETFLKGQRSTVSLAKYRPKRRTRPQICKAVAAEIGEISADTVDRYWKEYRRILNLTRLSNGSKT